MLKIITGGFILMGGFNGPNKSPLPIGEAKQPKDEVLIRVGWVEVGLAPYESSRKI